MSFVPLLTSQPRKPYSDNLLRAHAEIQDRAFASASEGLVGHVSNWDSKVANQAFYLVAGTHRYQDGRRSTKHCTTFQVKADAIHFAQRWRLNCPDDEIAVLVCDATWRPFEPETKTDQAALKKIAGKPSGGVAAPRAKAGRKKPAQGPVSGTA